ncbi:MAG: SUMF1/EgtB/PvdO family nonheme iron enzyme [Planctomycetota bacterium]|nr:SUMF1/EgtB/PvdO family nonheme iron enzyme [Planctomycetota bacterium]
MRHKTTLTARNTAFLALAAACVTACETQPAKDESAARAVEAPANPSRDARAPVAAGPVPPGAALTPAPVERAGPTPPGPQVAAPAAPTQGMLAGFEILVPGTTAKLVLAPIPAAEVQAADGTRASVAPFLAATTEITWDMYDAFVFAMERAETEKDPPDAFARPSKPYILMDRGFGHAGYPVISVSFRGATQFCRWLSNRTGKHFRLPTEAEWTHAARGGIATDPDAAALDASTWYQPNSKTRGRLSTHPVGKKAANGYGLHDVLGNAAEWTVGAEGKGVLRGGSFKDPAEKAALSARLPDDPAFNATDPQIPKSVWWLADGPFAGFRVVCDP